jgi:hypothetical protein
MTDRTTKPTTREIERHYFEQFRKVYSLPEGSIAYGDKPDVLITGKHTIGIEITRLYVQPGTLLDSEQRQRPLRKSVLSQAQDMHRAATGKSVALWVGFDVHNPITPARAKELPAQLATFAESIGSRESGEVDRHLFHDSIPELHSIYLNANEYEGASWQISQVYGVDLMSTEAVESIVREKETKSAGYNPCESNWLLIVVDWCDAAQEQEIRVDGFKLASTVFDRIIVYKPNFEHVVELKP